MTEARITCNVRVAWWLVPYIKVLAFFCRVAGAQPDVAKLSAKVRSAVTVTADRAEQ